ncbi:MAG: DUF3883 domain-containing protein [Nanoarchaeota archaeon]|nr:DUF3883 domain-containing protein [Nanoarchaeota archaeon]
MSNIVRDKAVKFVISYEKKRGWDAEKMPNGAGYDVISKKDSKIRYIEVKGKSSKNIPFVHFHKDAFKKVGNQSGDMRKYFLYLVYNINKKPTLKIVPSSTILQNIELDASFLLRGKAINTIEDSKDFP